MSDLAAVYLAAADLIEERGWAREYAYRSGCPLDLPRAIMLAEHQTGYSARERAPGEILADHQGKSCSALSRELDGPQALDLLRWAAANLETVLAVKAEKPPPTPRTCQECGEEFFLGRGGSPKFCGLCRARAREQQS